MANKNKKCKQCKDYKEAAKGFQTPCGWFCCFDHVQKWQIAKRESDHNKKIAKLKQTHRQKIKADNAAHRAKKAALKPASKWLSEAQTNVNKYIRIRDKHDPCISCGKSRLEIEADQGWKVGGCWDAGHYQGRGKKAQLRFLLFNIHKQCKSCNGGSGKFSHKAATVEQNYKINLIKKIGIEKVEWLENNNELDVHKKDIEYLKRVKSIFSKKARLYERRFRA